MGQNSQGTKTIVHLIAGARPNFVKIAPLFHVLASDSCLDPRIVHTGQHYTPELSDFIFRDLRLPPPRHSLAVGSGTLTGQTARGMLAYESLLRSEARPDLVVVVGDVNSTLACALTAKQFGLKVAHLESGLRSRDWTMPEELNRVLTDQLSDELWTPSADADANLLREGIHPDKIRRVGNIMIDCLEMLRPQFEGGGSPSNVDGPTLDPESYIVLTLHRPSNVDSASRLEFLLGQIEEISRSMPLVFPVHPRTQDCLEQFDFLKRLKANRRIHLTGPLPYIEFMRLVNFSRLVLTDSGGIQEETSYLGIRCLTIRENTERPITVSKGTNQLVSAEGLPQACARALTEPARTPCRIELWEGNTAKRVAERIRILTA